MTVTVRAAAEADLEEAFDYYRSIRRDLGDGFLDEFRRAVDRILQYPRGWQPLDPTFRRCRLHRFPYGIIYRLDEQAQQVVVVAVQHLNRRPDGWRRRG
jgi:plasmid stabilization system protein ParE